MPLSTFTQGLTLMNDFYSYVTVTMYPEELSKYFGVTDDVHINANRFYTLLVSEYLPQNKRNELAELRQKAKVTYLQLAHLARTRDSYLLNTLETI